jgi:hypothetical protein
MSTVSDAMNRLSLNTHPHPFTNTLVEESRIAQQLGDIFPQPLTELVAAYARKPQYVVFLDVEHCLGPVNTTPEIQNTVSRLFSKSANSGYHSGPSRLQCKLQWRIAHAHCFYPEAISAFQAFIAEAQKVADVAIVIIGPFAADGTAEELRNDMFAMHPFSALIIGKTANQYRPDLANESALYSDFRKEYDAASENNPHFVSPECFGIKHWLKQNEHLKIDNFVIIKFRPALATEQCFSERICKPTGSFSKRDGDLALRILNLPHRFNDQTELRKSTT